VISDYDVASMYQVGGDIMFPI